VSKSRGPRCDCCQLAPSWLRPDALSPAPLGRWQACFRSTLSPVEKLRDKCAWDIVPDYLEDGVVPADMTRSEYLTINKKKKGCTYVPPPLDKETFNIPATKQQKSFKLANGREMRGIMTSVIVEEDMPSNRGFIEGLRQLDGAKIGKEPTFVDLPLELLRATGLGCLPYRITMCDQGMYIISFQDAATNQLCLKVPPYGGKNGCHRKFNTETVPMRMHVHNMMRFAMEGRLWFGRTLSTPMTDHINRNKRDNRWCDLRCALCP